MSKTSQAFQWQDPFLLDQQLSDEERQVKDAAATYCQERLLPRVLESFRHEKTDVAIFKEMGELGLLGPTISPSYGGAGLNYVCYGLVAREVERVDSGYRSMMSVQSSLVMVPIQEFGSESQKKNTFPNWPLGSGSDALGSPSPTTAQTPEVWSPTPKK
jgi:glutaryl-CoA dehydrogenase